MRRAGALRRRTSCRSGWRPDSPPRYSRSRARRAARAISALVLDREIDALGLRAVAQRGVEEIDAFARHRVTSQVVRARPSSGPGVLQHDALGGELVADAVGLLEVLRLARAALRAAMASRDRLGAEATVRLASTQMRICSMCTRRRRSRGTEAQRAEPPPMSCAVQLVQLGDGLGRVEIVGERIEHRARVRRPPKPAFLRIAVPVSQQRLMRFLRGRQRSNPSAAGNGSSAC